MLLKEEFEDSVNQGRTGNTMAKQQSTNTTQKIKDQATQTPLKTGGASEG